MNGIDGSGDQAADRPLSPSLLMQAQDALGNGLDPEQLDLVAELSSAAERFHASGQLPQAELAYILAGALQEAILGTENVAVALTNFNLASVYESAGKLKPAERLYRNALRVMESKLGDDHPDVIVGLQSLASCCLAQGEYATAEVLHQNLLEAWERALGPDHPAIATRLDRYAELLRALNREEEAVKVQARSRRIRSRQQDSL